MQHLRTCIKLYQCWQDQQGPKDDDSSLVFENEGMKAKVAKHEQEHE